MLVVGLLLFVSLVVVHEWGHFIMARRNGVDVEEFGIGFPPKLFTYYKDKKGTEYTLNLLPLGGFVRLKGEHDQDTQHGAFGAASFWAKTKIILAGVVMNLVTAWLMFTLLALVGIPKLPLPDGSQQFTVASDTKVVSNKVIVVAVEKDGPAEKAGLQRGDIIEGFYTGMGDDASRICLESSTSNQCFYDAGDVRLLTEQILSDGASSLVLRVNRGDLNLPVTVTPRTLDEVSESSETDSPKGYLGIVPQDYTVQRSTWSAPIVGAGLIGQFSKLTYSALATSVAGLFKGDTTQASENVSGPVGIFVVLREGASFGITYILLIIALLSLTLAIMNTLPIPALDGGKLFVMALFRLIRKPLTPVLEERIHGTGFVALMIVFVLITVVDVQRFF